MLIFLLVFCRRARLGCCEPCGCRCLCSCTHRSFLPPPCLLATFSIEMAVTSTLCGWPVPGPRLEMVQEMPS
ncbi:hypothetical protein CABS01_00342 [Colletotrichum abscissum]|uniref:uncharacterized protein n=1 Tax=Colletotrichum abscissum TaxID=1671311 RepID=UPI0027D6F1CB|nr:uncharacterized protein CABS01_00342 [Colletotrichum abscissum]KAK1525253.1 hypothetical protein CABS01_00342 [Colletotrichum abscissum]